LPVYIDTVSIRCTLSATLPEKHLTHEHCKMQIVTEQALVDEGLFFSTVSYCRIIIDFSATAENKNVFWLKRNVWNIPEAHC
jgi:hypothetical protein